MFIKMYLKLQPRASKKVHEASSSGLILIIFSFCLFLKVLDSLVRLTCRSDVSSEVRWLGVWLVRQLLPHAGEEFTSSHLSQLKVRIVVVPYLSLPLFWRG